LTGVSISIDDPKIERASWYAASEITKPASSPLIVKIDRGVALDGIQTVWQDDQKASVERILTDIAINVLLIGEHTCRSREMSRYQWLVKRRVELIEQARRDEEEAERAERQRRIKEEQEHIERLLREARALREAEEIRDYVKSVRKLTHQSNEQLPNDEILAWAEWALKQADRIDPVVSRLFLKSH
jgi:hypothetical protein